MTNQPPLHTIPATKKDGTAARGIATSIDQGETGRIYINAERARFITPEHAYILADALVDLAEQLERAQEEQ